MVLAIEARFGSNKPPRPIEFLADNGSAYVAKETPRFAPLLNLMPLKSPPNLRQF
jgi:transposase InsO family protein